jgi:phosphodiesterase/alkaline phosphatase D-like protein
MKLLLAAVAALLLPAWAQAEAPRHVRLSFTHADATTRVTVAWNTTAADAPSTVQVGKGSTYPLSFTGTQEQAKGGIGWVHQVEVTGLTPDTQYHYRAGGEGGWSPDQVFHTPPADPCAPLRLVFLGDGRSDDETGASPRWPPVLEEGRVAQAPRHLPHWRHRA